MQERRRVDDADHRKSHNPHRPYRGALVRPIGRGTPKLRAIDPLRNRNNLD
jgi:hypothetical protein